MSESEAVDFEEGEGLVVDFNNVEDTSFEALPRGKYEATIADCEFTYSQNSGNPMWTLKYEVAEGEYAGRTLFSHMVMAGKGLPITKKQLGRIKPELLEGPFDPSDEDVVESMIGLSVVLSVVTRKYEGEQRNNVKDVFPNEDGGFAS